METIGAVILAAGSGNRMKSAVPKQFMMLNDLPVYLYSVKLFDCIADKIVLVTSEEAIDACCHALEEKHLQAKWSVISGGEQRYLSSMEGVAAAADCDIIMIHDAARACVSMDVLMRSIEMTREKGCGVAAVALKDTVKVADSRGQVIHTPDRSSLRVIQTPQSFRKEIILQAYDRLRADIEAGSAIAVTDDAAVVEAYTEYPVYLSEGSYENLKLTTPEDMAAAEQILKKMKKYVKNSVKHF